MAARPRYSEHLTRTKYDKTGKSRMVDPILNSGYSGRRQLVKIRQFWKLMIA